MTPSGLTVYGFRLNLETVPFYSHLQWPSSRETQPPWHWTVAMKTQARFPHGKDCLWKTSSGASPWPSRVGPCCVLCVEKELLLSTKLLCEMNENGGRVLPFTSFQNLKCQLTYQVTSISAGVKCERSVELLFRLITESWWVGMSTSASRVLQNKIISLLCSELPDLQ